MNKQQNARSIVSEETLDNNGALLELFPRKRLGQLSQETGMSNFYLKQYPYTIWNNSNRQTVLRFCN
jgi:hypothetical protein